MISVRALSLKFAGREILRDATFRLVPGSVVALLGPNGAGKSSLLKFLAGLLISRELTWKGEVLLNDEALSLFSQRRRARRIAYVGSDLQTDFPLTALQVVELRARASDTVVSMTRLEQAMSECECWSLRDRTVETLSGGERQRVAFAAVLAQQPEVYLLDESLSKMDLNHQALAGRIMRRLASRGSMVVLVAHDVNLALEWADGAVLMRDGAVVAEGKVVDVVSTESIQSLYPGSTAQVANSPITGSPQVFFGKAP